MREFTMLIGQLVLIAIMQTVLELFIDVKERPIHGKILDIACVMGSFYLLLQFIFDYMLDEISNFINFPL